MTTYEYQVVPAPRKAKAPRKVKGPEAKFATTLTDVINEMAADGWEYQRAETLPCDERQGFTGRTTKYHSVLVFRRAVSTAPAPEEAIETPALSAVAAAPVVAAPAAISEPVLEPQLTRAEEGPAPEGFLQGDDTVEAEAEDEQKRDESA
ncbi:uncharacterized protein DUF4177 [Litoreibacter ponti]|uniref:Uncharacterized protein DUF4177 n=1 Tax=Litoreibacter ponti TaxID=1510457 RepID=A0A2T6BDC0_9RHOB|nr:DUF4177 domain-containing protein [Litoreibacter ponti]PTX54029.1 uncharacterized protein DUF4177 [Litoreibacter ponti]